MDSLKGKKILIGKEPGNGRLMIAVEGCGNTATIGQPGCVPNCVTRCRQAEGVAHALLAVDISGNLTLTNMKDKNVTFVNGSEIASKRVIPSNSVELGRERYPVSLNVIMSTAEKIVLAASRVHHNQAAYQQHSVSPQQHVTPQQQAKPTPPKRYNISHLSDVWDALQDGKKQIQNRHNTINLVRSVCAIFTGCAMPCIFFFGPVGYVLTGVGILGNIYSFFGMRKGNSADTMEQLTEDFQDRYICPNRECGKFLGNLSYRLLKRQYSMHCPYCKCEYYE